MKVFINAGHMVGVDSGAVNNAYGITEAEVTKKIGNLLAQLLMNAGHEVQMVQSDNLAGESPNYTNVTASANRWGADIFVSIHCNAAGSSQAHGTETFCYSYEGEGYKLATCINDSITSKLGTADRGVKVNQSFIVLKRTAMTAVLVETAFISNPEDCYKLINNQYDFAQAIFAGIEKFVA